MVVGALPKFNNTEERLLQKPLQTESQSDKWFSTGMVSGDNFCCYNWVEGGFMAFSG
jgi:hypothetical protein